ncbi:cation-transporting P-type ATPase [Candidatus Poribacteria bacterium]|nr:cation-transporting P-type ATPase [Candidatus Poribacteria bacterium]
MESEWHAIDISQLAQELNTDLTKGLKNDEVPSRLIKRAPPRAEVFRYTPPIQRYLVIYLAILILSFIALMLTGERGEAIALLSFAALGSLILLLARRISSRAMDKVPIPEGKVKVVREGELIEARETAIVPGDLIVFEAGDRVPADVRIVKSEGLKVDQNRIWPDNPIAEKRADVCQPDVSPPERHNMIYRGSFVLEGKGMGVVVAVDDEVSLPGRRRIGRHYEETEPQLIANDISVRALLASLIFGLITFVTLWAFRRNFAYSLSFGSGFIVASFPWTLSLLTSGMILRSFGMINQRYALMKRLIGMDDIDDLSILCVEREWGITEDRYLVDMVFLDGRLMTREEMREIISLGDAKKENDQGGEEGEEEKGDEEDEKELADDLKLLATTAYFSLNSRWNEGRALRLLDEYSFDEELEGFCRELDLPLTEYLATLEKISERNGEDGSFRAVVMRDPGGTCFTFMAGYVGEMLSKCSHILVFGSQGGMDGERKEALRNVAAHMEREGLKVIALAYGQPEEVEEGEYNPEKAEFGLTLVGLLGLKNPVRDGIAGAISSCRESGMRVVIMSDDDPEFACDLARDIGLIDSRTSMLADEEIGEMTDQQLEEQIDRVSLYLSLSPRNKEKVIRVSQSKKHKVGFMSIRHEDWSPFKASDVKITSLHRGSDLLVEESDIALSQGGLDGFAKAFNLVRSTFLSVYNAIKWLLSSHLGQGLTLLISFLLLTFWADGFPLPMRLRQILWLNFWAVMLPSIGLMAEVGLSSDRCVSSIRKVRINEGYKVDILLRGVVLALMALLGGVLTLEFSRYDESLELRFRTTVVTILLLAQLLFIFQCHRGRREGLLERIVANRPLLALVLLAMAAHITSIYLTPLANLLGFSPIGVEWAWIGVLCLIPLLPLNA